MNALHEEVRQHLKRERELHAYAVRLAAKLAAHPHYGAWMLAMSRRGRHRCGGRFARHRQGGRRLEFEEKAR